MIKRLLVPLLAITFTCSACVNGDTAGTTGMDTTVASPETMATLSNSGSTEAQALVSNADSQKDSQKDSQSNTGLTENDLIEFMEKACGSKLETHLYTDLDRDGKSELLGSFAVNFIYQTWYCSSDGKICEKVLENTMDFDACTIDMIEHENATHAAVNTYNLMGNYKTFAILALQDGKINCLASDVNGYASMDENGNPCVTIEGYDAYLDATIGSGVGHTWKNTYVTFDEKTNTYLEIPAKEISEAEFLKFTNGKEVLDTIKSSPKITNPLKVEYSFLKRDNGFVHVQCAEHDQSKGITFHYYTLAYEDNTILDFPGISNDGIMGVQMTEFKATE